MAMMVDPEQLFAEALEVQPEHRAAFLDQACRNSPEIRQVVDKLLRDHQRAASLPISERSTPRTPTAIT